MRIDEAGAVERLRAGEVVVLPTDTLYGLCVAADLAGATARLFAIKARPLTVALPVFAVDANEAYELGDFDRAGRELVEPHWPGALTAVVRRTERSAAWDLGGDGTTIGLRVPDDDLVHRICAAVGPLAVTSANRHSEPSCTTAEEVARALGDIPVLDGGTRDRPASTVVDLTGDSPRVLRPGNVVIGGRLEP